MRVPSVRLGQATSSLSLGLLSPLALAQHWSDNNKKDNRRGLATSIMGKKKKKKIKKKSKEYANIDWKYYDEVQIQVIKN